MHSADYIDAAMQCGGLSALLRLVADIGPAGALTVTFLIPLFTLTWGALFLHETVNLNPLIGCALAVLATWLAVFQRNAAVQ
jgi:drug/metabolite transporter (DMT)-like permease